ncbi:hypothetical protein OB919_14300 [Halobacteria archaeon AArc-curdl1]|uniref:Uncharacterized protein n=1 Tax=Natronosalvus hydrolyticus TaxID=2979988 RepID=A0AAP2Z9E3_9EURY|nr:hypothetical protein [Halobacteria archaeon AArc-curdl1]
MKSGATDPFAQDDEGTDEEESAEAGATTPEGTSDRAPREDSSSVPEEPVNSSPSVGNTGQFDRSDLPYTLRRNNVKDERDSVHQLFVREGTDQQAREAERELEDRLGDVYRLDAREAIYLAGMQNLDDAEAVLRKWGVDI